MIVDQTIDGPCFCDRISDQACRLKEIRIERFQTVKRIQCDECGLRFKRIELKRIGELDADVFKAA